MNALFRNPRAWLALAVLVAIVVVVALLASGGGGGGGGPSVGY